MNHDLRQARMYAVVGTALVLALVLALLMLCHLSMSSVTPKPDSKGDIVLDEEFIEFEDLPVMPDLTGDADALATADSPNEAQPTPISGTDVDNAGDAGTPPPVVSSNADSHMKVGNKKDKKKPEGPAVDKKKQEEDAIKRQANNDVANAFNRSTGNHNTAQGTNDNGDSGTQQGTSPTGTLTGHGVGTAGGGWSLPNYAPVRSTVTGSVKMKLTIDRLGNVTSVQFNGGDAPAATNTAVRNACKAEVMARRFTRANHDDAPETSTAYITYTFK